MKCNTKSKSESQCETHTSTSFLTLTLPKTGKLQHMTMSEHHRILKKYSSKNE